MYTPRAGETGLLRWSHNVPLSGYVSAAMPSACYLRMHSQMRLDCTLTVVPENAEALHIIERRETAADHEPSDALVRQPAIRQLEQQLRVLLAQGPPRLEV